MVSALLFSSFSNAFANSLVTSKLPNVSLKKISVQKNEDGKYVKAKNKSKSIKAVLTEDEGIYRTESGDLIKSYGDTYVRVEKVKANLIDIDEIKKISTNLDLPKEVAEDLLIDSQKAIDSNNNSSVVSLIVPKKINNESSEITIFSIPSTTDYYTHDGYFLKDISYEVTNIDTPTDQVIEGAGVADYIADASLLTITGLGIKNLTAAIIGAGWTILDFIIDKFSVNEIDVQSDPKSFVEMNITYDKTRKYTYVSVTGKEEDYVIGAKTLYLLIDNVYTKTHTVVDGVGETAIKNNGTDQKFKTKNYDDPADIAIANYAYGYWDEAYFDVEEEDFTYHFD